MDRHRSLAIFESGELLRARHGNGGVTGDHFLDQATHGFQPQRERNHIEQQHFAVRLVTDQNIRLNRGPNRHHFIRVVGGERRAAKEFAHAFTHQRYAR
ncbi:NAD-specific glutamate dehydrogenase [compost metagenome]